MTTCPVITEFLGSPHPCVDDPTTRLVLRCDDGHDRVLDACDFHARVACEEVGATFCRVCDETAHREVPVRLVSVAPLPDAD